MRKIVVFVIVTMFLIAKSYAQSYLISETDLCDYIKSVKKISIIKNMSVISENTPLNSVITTNSIHEWCKEKHTSKEILDKVSDIFDYEYSIKSNVILMRKKYSNPLDFPDIDIREMNAFLENSLHKIDKLIYGGIPNKKNYRLEYGTRLVASIGQNVSSPIKLKNLSSGQINFVESFSGVFFLQECRIGDHLEAFKQNGILTTFSSESDYKNRKNEHEKLFYRWHLKNKPLIEYVCNIKNKNVSTAKYNRWNSNMRTIDSLLKGILQVNIKYPEYIKKRKLSIYGVLNKSQILAAMTYIYGYKIHIDNDLIEIANVKMNKYTFDNIQSGLFQDIPLSLYRYLSQSKTCGILSVPIAQRYNQKKIMDRKILESCSVYGNKSMLNDKYISDMSNEDMFPLYVKLFSNCLANIVSVIDFGVPVINDIENSYINVSRYGNDFTVGFLVRQDSRFFTIATYNSRE